MLLPVPMRQPALATTSDRWRRIDGVAGGSERRSPCRLTGRPGVVPYPSILVVVSCGPGGGVPAAPPAGFAPR